MTDKSFYLEVARLTEKDLETEPGNLLPSTPGFIDREFIRTRLTGVIRHMLDHEFEKLCNTMYRLDVSETKFNSVLTGEARGDIPGRLADLVIDREIQKVKTRQLYRNRKE